MSVNRRNFIRSSAAGLLGSVLLSQHVSGLTDPVLRGLPPGFQPDDEDWWELVKSQFSIEEGLLYFNNGSLGASPEYVIDKTEKFRRMLDGYPSKYMWGGWEPDKERVRGQIADYFSVSKEEIAVTHNTTEGMNLFARSFNLKEGDEIILGAIHTFL